jgi:hypothetical protein
MPRDTLNRLSGLAPGIKSNEQERKMRKLNDFYKRAETDTALAADIEAAKKAYAGKKPDAAVIKAETIKIAAKHGVDLTDADFATAELDDKQLEAVAGGSGACIEDISSDGSLHPTR